jgi:hypothetical protein
VHGHGGSAPAARRSVVGGLRSGRGGARKRTGFEIGVVAALRPAGRLVAAGRDAAVAILLTPRRQRPALRLVRAAEQVPHTADEIAAAAFLTNSIS